MHCLLIGMSLNCMQFKYKYLKCRPTFLSSIFIVISTNHYTNLSEIFWYGFISKKKKRKKKSYCSACYAYLNTLFNSQYLYQGSADSVLEGQCPA